MVRGEYGPDWSNTARVAMAGLGSKGLNKDKQNVVHPSNFH